MIIAVTILHVIVSIGLILVVLLQTGKGAEIGAVFGGSSSTIFGSSGAGNLYPAAGGTYGGGVAFTEAPSAISPNAWTHIAQTYDGSTIRLYVNGALVRSLAQTGALETNSSPLSIGGTNAYGEFFEGHIDDVRVYDRALSVSEISSDMNAPVASPGP